MSQLARRIKFRIVVAVLVLTAPIASAQRPLCTIPDAKFAKAQKTFARIAAVFRHPRCNNCHGGLDPFSANTPHVGGSYQVGATQAKQDAMETSAADWGMYSSFVEERVTAQIQKVSAGNYHVQTSAALAAGEYGVALRPVNKDKKFAGSSIAQNVGDGLIFNSVWAFEIQ